MNYASNCTHMFMRPTVNWKHETTDFVLHGELRYKPNDLMAAWKHRKLSDDTASDIRAVSLLTV